MKESKNHIEAAPKFLLKGSWEGAASLISLRSTIFYFFVLLSSMLFCFAFHSLWLGSFVQTDLPLWKVSVSTNCHSVTPRQMSTLENSQPPSISVLEHISHPNPQFAMDQTICGCNSLDSRASPLQGSLTQLCGEVFCVGEECSHFGGETQTQFKAGEDAIQQFWQEQNNNVVSGFDLELVAIPHIKN